MVHAAKFWIRMNAHTWMVSHSAQHRCTLKTSYAHNYLSGFCAENSQSHALSCTVGCGGTPCKRSVLKLINAHLRNSWEKTTDLFHSIKIQWRVKVNALLRMWSLQVYELWIYGHMNHLIIHMHRSYSNACLLPPLACLFTHLLVCSHHLLACLLTCSFAHITYLLPHSTLSVRWLICWSVGQ